MREMFKLSQEHIERIEAMINNVVSTVEGSDDIEMKIIDNDEYAAILYVCVDSGYKKKGD
jgi:hypothetical protein